MSECGVRFCLITQDLKYCELLPRNEKFNTRINTGLWRRHFEGELRARHWKILYFLIGNNI